MNHSKIVSEFIEEIWNKRNFEKLPEFIHPDFKDYSLPPAFSSDMEGMKQWIMNTCISFEHRTVIEEQVTENEKSIVKIKMFMQHIGPWRNFEATHIELTAIGYRYYKMQEGKIIAHWALIDGQSIENQITHAFKGCKIGA